MSICVAQVNRFGDNSEYAKVLAAYERVVSSFSGFIEAANEIFLAMCPECAPPRDREFIHKWLVDKGYKVGKHFHGKIRNETNYFREIFNKLKHSGNQLRGISATNGATWLVGYCLEHADAGGAIAPNVDFHKRYDHKKPANSFHRDIRRLFFLLYRVSDELGASVTEHLRTVWGSSLLPDLLHREDDTACKRLLAEIQKLPATYFPNETGLKVPCPTLENSHGGQSLKFMIDTAAPCPGSWRVQMRTVGDGVSKKFHFTAI